MRTSNAGAPSLTDPARVTCSCAQHGADRFHAQDWSDQRTQSVALGPRRPTACPRLLSPCLARARQGERLNSTFSLLCAVCLHLPYVERPPTCALAQATGSQPRICDPFSTRNSYSVASNHYLHYKSWSARTETECERRLLKSLRWRNQPTLDGLRSDSVASSDQWARAMEVSTTSSLCCEE